MRRSLMTAASAVALFVALAGGAISHERSASDVVLANEPGALKVYDELACQGGEDSSDQPKVTSPLSIGGSGFSTGPAVLLVLTHPEGKVVLDQGVTVASDGTFCVSPITLGEGMYKAHLYRNEQADGKHKVFKVEPAVTTTTTTTTVPDDSTTTTTTLPDDSTTTTTSVAAGGPTTTTIVGSDAVTTTAAPTVDAGGPTPNTGGETWLVALTAALLLLAGTSLVTITRR